MIDFPITIYRGATFGPFTIYVKDAVGSVLNLTGYAVSAHLRSKRILSLDMLPVITNAATGEITIEFTFSATELLLEVEGVWDLILIDPSLKRLGPYIGGYVSIITPVTQL